MSGHKPFSNLTKEIDQSPERRRCVNEMERAFDDAEHLTKLRTQQNLTQQDVADTLNVSQANISRIEHEDDLYLSTLRAYDAACLH